MFELPQRQPTMWKQAAGVVFGLVGRGLGAVWRAARIAVDPFWRSAIRKPLFLIAGIALTIFGYRAAMDESFHWWYIDGPGEGHGFLIVLAGVVLLYLAFQKSKPRGN
jgi:hypothetical protein